MVLHTSRIGVASVMRIQFQVMVACPKHYTAYNPGGGKSVCSCSGIKTIDALVKYRTLPDVYLPICTVEQKGEKQREVEAAMKAIL